ncbi:hypothetical protein Pst134EA_015943 [Puccinia striiformis f. sp. tritici]|nr:hypothetical protein Pst134EA_015943 [Puccinia striiformis f. sp. tritici]KAH9463863.1 hypothetical protein Pst134EA_015943 [Puccinia striiformis f. sp. tritici]KAI9605337.1 hypothetical protein KEM48_002277 [Puccinia striiformis f. sp. tritici PST-130]
MDEMNESPSTAVGPSCSSGEDIGPLGEAASPGDNLRSGRARWTAYTLLSKNPKEDEEVTLTINNLSGYRSLPFLPNETFHTGA